MSEEIKNYAPPSDELLEILGMRLYDIMNQLCSQMMRNGSTEDYIEFNCHNGLNGKFYRMKVSLEELD